MNLKIKFLLFVAVILCAILTRPTSGINAQEVAEGGTKVAWSPDGQYLTVSGSLAGVFLYSRKNAAGPLKSFSQISAINDVVWSPDGTKLVTADADYSVRVWDAHNYSVLAILEAHTKPANSISWSRDGSKFASVGDDGKLVIWDGKTY